MSEDDWIMIGVGIAGLIGLYLITRRWFWAMVFFFATLASFFAMVASVIHFQILGAIGFFILMVICGGIFSATVDN